MRKGTYFEPTPVNYIFYKRGIGDIIAAFKVTQTIRKKWPHCYPILWVPDFMTGLTKHMLKDYLENVGVYGWSEMKEKIRDFPTKRYDKQSLNTWRIPLMIQNYLWMTDYYPKGDELDYPIFKSDGVDLSKFDLPEKFITICTTHNAKNKEFYSRHIRKIIKWAKKKGVESVLLGNTIQTYINDGKTYKTQYAGNKFLLGGVSLVNKTSLVEAGAIIAKSQALVGIDGGLIHLGACTHTPLVCGFTVVRPDLFTPQRSGVFGKDYYVVEPEKTLGCRFCHSQINFTRHGDVFTCFYKDNKCCDQMDSYKFINHLEKILDETP